MAILNVATAQGDFSIALAEQAAPKTCAYFTRLAREGALDNSSIFRIVYPDTTIHSAAHPIAVIQGGLTNDDHQPVSPIAHESTKESSLQHKRWTVSTARFAPGETYGSFFVCMRDEPVLDHGGPRHPDGLGFAAFGEVEAGRDVVEAIYKCGGSSEMLSRPILIRSVRVA